MVLIKKGTQKIKKLGEKAEEKDYEGMLIKHRRRMVLLLALLLVFAAAVVIAVKIFLDNRVYDAYEISNTTDMGDVMKCRFYKYGNGVLRYSNDGISYMIGDDTIWNQAFEMKQPLVDICDGYMAIADLGDTTVYIYNESGQQGIIEATCPILELEVAAQGVVALITQNEITNLIEIYDKEGANIAMGQTVLSGDGCPLDISISNDGTKLAVSYVYLKNNMARTKVIFYNYSGVGKNEAGRIVGGFENYEESIISKVEFVTNDVVVAFGDDILTIYSMEEKPSVMKEVKIEREIESIAYNNKYVLLAFKSENSVNQHILNVYDLNGKRILDTTVEFSYTDIQLQNNMIILNNSKQMYMLSVDNVKKYNGEINEGIVKVIPTKTENRFIIITNEEAEEIKLK